MGNAKRRGRARDEFWIGGTRGVSPRDDEMVNKGRNAVRKACGSLSAPMPRTTVARTLPSESRQASTKAPAAAGVCAPSKTITRVPSVIRSKRPGQLADASPVRIDSSGT